MTTSHPIRFTETKSVMARSPGTPPADKQAPAPPALPLDLAAQTDEMLALLVTDAQAEQQRRKDKREADLYAYVKEHAQALGIPMARFAARLAGRSAKPSMLRPASADAGGEDDRRRNPKPIFWNPQDHSQRWTKKGNQPRWFRDHLAAGGTEEECRIPEGALAKEGEP